MEHVAFLEKIWRAEVWGTVNIAAFRFNYEELHITFSCSVSTVWL
jgi:hypothetical protein